MKSLWILAFGLLSLPALAKDCSNADVELAETYKAMQAVGNYGELWNEQTLQKQTQKFEQTLECLKQPESWQMDFALAAAAGVRIESAEDKNLRAFSWDYQTGGTLHEFGYALQYRQPNGKTGVLFDEKGDEVIKIQQATLNQQPYYWVMTYSIGDGRNHGVGTRLYQITDNGLDFARLIKTSSITSELGFAYDPIETPENRAPNSIGFFYDDKAKTLRFPVVVQQKEQYGSGKVTNKWIQYRFNGQYFIREKN